MLSQGRSNQRLRTRKDLLLAGARLLKQGSTPRMEEIAKEALVSRATAYRYFPSVEALLVEVPIDGAVLDPQDLFVDDSSVDPEERIDRAEAAMHETVYRNEGLLRTMLAHRLEAGAKGGVRGSTPIRQNRRTAYIEAALAPTRKRFEKAGYQRLCAALALIFGIESMVIFRDVLPLDEKTAREVKSWAVRALVRAALAESKAAS